MPAYPEPRGIRGIVFDLDGTLVDSYAAITESLNLARAAFSLPPLGTDEVRRSVGHGLEHLIAEKIGPGRVEEGVRVFREHYAKILREKTLPLAGVDSMLRRLLDAGFRLSVASNKPARFTREILAALGWADRFRAVHGPETAGAAKPDPAMIRLCMEAMGTQARTTVYVGDMVLDVESADRAGVPVVLLAGGSSPIEELRRTGRTVLESRDDLPAFLDLPGGERPAVRVRSATEGRG